MDKQYLRVIPRDYTSYMFYPAANNYLDHQILTLFYWQC